MLREDDPARANIFTITSRIENMLFEGVIQPIDGALAPTCRGPGHGLEFKRADAERFKI